MSKKLEKEKLVRVCPKCGSKNVEIDPVIGNTAPFYICKSCGLGGPLFPEITSKDAKKLKEKSVHYSPIFSPTKKPFSVPLALISLTFGTIALMSIILSVLHAY